MRHEQAMHLMFANYYSWRAARLVSLANKNGADTLIMPRAICCLINANINLLPALDPREQTFLYVARTAGVKFGAQRSKTMPPQALDSLSRRKRLLAPRLTRAACVWGDECFPSEFNPLGLKGWIFAHPALLQRPDGEKETLGSAHLHWSHFH